MTGRKQKGGTFDDPTPEQEEALNNFIRAFDLLAEVASDDVAIQCAKEIQKLRPGKKGRPKKSSDLFHGVMGLYDYALGKIERGELKIQKRNLVKWVADEGQKLPGIKKQSADALQKYIRRKLDERNSLKEKYKLLMPEMDKKTE